MHQYPCKDYIEDLMSACVLLNLLNDFRKGDKMWAISLINPIIQEHEC